MTTWLERMREVPEYVETYGDPANIIGHMRRATERVDAFERRIDREVTWPTKKRRRRRR